MSTAPQSQPRPRGWFKRNWKWFVPLVLLLIVAGTALTMAMPSLRLKYSEPFRLVTDQLNKHPKVQEAVGSPAGVPGVLGAPAGWVNDHGARGDAQFTFTWKGPKGAGVASAKVNKVDNQWGTVPFNLTLENGETIRVAQDGGALPAIDPNAKAGPIELKEKPAGADVTLPPMPEMPK